MQIFSGSLLHKHASQQVYRINQMYVNISSARYFVPVSLPYFHMTSPACDRPAFLSGTLAVKVLRFGGEQSPNGLKTSR